jgi:hypothetical protein
MDGGEKEKDAAAETRRLIKNAARREPAPASLDRNFSNAPSSGRSPTRDSGSPLEKDLANIVLHGAPQDSVTSTPGTLQAEQELLKSNPESRSNSAIPIATWTQSEHFNGLERAIDSASPRPVDYSLPPALKGREASLLMYHMDSVFPLQFRMYSPTAVEGGRGWFLTLLLRTPPMYYMTLALSAHCFEMTEAPNGAKERKQASFVRLASALQNLQQYVRMYSQPDNPGSLKESIKVLGCILQMVAFIVCLLPSSPRRKPEAVC